MTDPAALRIVANDPEANPTELLLDAQKDVLEMMVRGRALPEILDALCRIVERLADSPTRATIEPVETDAGAVQAPWSVPIVSSAGHVLGTFNTFFIEPREPHTSERRLVDVLTRMAALAIEGQQVNLNLRESEQRYRAMIEASPECVKVVASDGTLLQMNAAGLRMMEAAEEYEVIGRNVYPVIAPEHRARFRAFNEQVCQGEGGCLEFDIIGLRGTRRTMESTAVALPSPGGTYLQLAVTRDVSARVAASHALSQSRARLDYAVRLSGVGFWYCDLPFDELVWDARVKEHFFLPPDARVTIDDFYARIHPGDREPTRAAIEASIQSGTSYDVVYRTVDPESGAIKWIRALGGTAYAPDGTPTRFDGVTVDVTVQRLDQQRLSDLNQRLREQDRRKDEFLATLAHELRNPLAPIRTGLQILRANATPEQAEKVREMMERQLGHMVRLVDDLLDISRVTLGKVTLKRERVDFRTVLHSALETTRPLIEAGAHELAVRLPQDPFPLDVDPTRLAQVIANLINNSAKYTPSGGRIQLSAATENDMLVVRVSDTGIGIPAEMLPRVFDIFTQVGRSVERSQGGLGIGLTLVRRLIEMHGGSVEAESPGIGMGSTFSVRLPLATSRSEPMANQSSEQASYERGRMRILVVDDNVDAAESLAMLLDLGGHETRMAHSGEAAVSTALEFHPDVAFVDIGLPGMSGYDVARQLRDAGRDRESLMLVALTGWGSDEDRRQAQAAGFDFHLVKPVDFDKLTDVLATRARRQQQQA